MKKYLSFVLALMLALGCMGIFATAGADIENWYVKTGNGKTLNVRDINTGEVIGRLAYGSQVGVTEWHGEWAYIVYGSIGDAKVMSKFLVNYNPGKYHGGSGENTTVLSDSALGSQTVDGLNKQFATMQYVNSYTVKVVPDTRTGTARLRWAPSKNATLLALVPANYELTVLASNASWLMVQDHVTHNIGWIAKKYTAQ